MKSSRPGSPTLETKPYRFRTLKELETDFERLIVAEELSKHQVNQISDLPNQKRAQQLLIVRAVFARIRQAQKSAEQNIINRNIQEEDNYYNGIATGVIRRLKREIKAEEYSGIWGYIPFVKPENCVAYAKNDEVCNVSEDNSLSEEAETAMIKLFEEFYGAQLLNDIKNFQASSFKRKNVKPQSSHHYLQMEIRNFKPTDFKHQNMPQPLPRPYFPEQFKTEPLKRKNRLKGGKEANNFKITFNKDPNVNSDWLRKRNLFGPVHKQIIARRKPEEINEQGQELTAPKGLSK